MAYSDFTLAELKQRFQLTLDESQDLFAETAEADLPPILTDLLARYLPLAVNVNTEKARSELLIAPFLVEFKLKYRDRVSLFSGIEFTVDKAAGLTGRCDYIISRSPEQLSLDTPVCVLVEAKNENIVAGIPQCLAEMVAAQQFNPPAQPHARHLVAVGPNRAGDGRVRLRIREVIGNLAPQPEQGVSSGVAKVQRDALLIGQLVHPVAAADGLGRGRVEGRPGHPDFPVLVQ